MRKNQAVYYLICNSLAKAKSPYLFVLPNKSTDEKLLSGKLKVGVPPLIDLRSSDSLPQQIKY